MQRAYKKTAAYAAALIFILSCAIQGDVCKRGNAQLFYVAVKIVEFFIVVHNYASFLVLFAIFYPS